LRGLGYAREQLILFPFFQCSSYSSVSSFTSSVLSFPGLYSDRPTFSVNKELGNEKAFKSKLDKKPTF